MNLDKINLRPHRRYNPLTNSWVQVSPHRLKRPWQGQKEDQNRKKDKTIYDPTCYLCPGNERAGGKKNPDYKKTFAFTNDFSALLMDKTDDQDNIQTDLFKAEGEQGICRVICFSPRHDLTIPEMSDQEVLQIVELWQNEFITLSKKQEINYVQIFENKGSIMGCSNPHPHGQIWAQSTIPDEPYKETISQNIFFSKHGKSLLAVYLEEELDNKQRIIDENEFFVSLVPFWSVWPFETMIISKRKIMNISEMSPEEMKSLAQIMKTLLIRYDNIFSTSFPYSSGIHQAPCDGNDYPGWHFHMHFYPPLLRSSNIKKFMVGYEMLANPQRDITAEESARMIRSMQTKHYTKINDYE